MNKRLLSEEKPPFDEVWFDSCKNHDLILSPINTKEKLEEVSHTLDVYNDINNISNDWWQIGLNFTNDN